MSESSTPPQFENCFDRIRAILGDAAGDEPTVYDGVGRFWELSRDEFVRAEVYGVPLIAPAVQKSCCGGGDSRSASSGLIRALRGAPPFDGSRFPPFMWGGKRVSDPDIDFIAAWIDDGCPPDDRLTSLALEPEVEPAIIERRVIRDVAEFEAITATAGRRGYREGELRQRPNLDCMKEPEVDQLREAFRQIYDINKFAADRRSYNNQALIHQNHCQHGWERFLPWHRAYLYEFEQNLQDFFPDLALPYWDWTMPQYWNRGSPKDGCILPERFKAYLTPAAAEKLVARLNPVPNPHQRAAFLKLAEDRTLFTTQHCFFCHVIGVIGYTNVTPAPDDRNRRAMIDALRDFELALVSAAVSGRVPYARRQERHHQPGDLLPLPLARRHGPDRGSEHVSRFRRRQRLQCGVRLPRPEPSQHNAHLDGRHESGRRGQGLRLR